MVCCRNPAARCTVAIFIIGYRSPGSHAQQWQMVGNLRERTAQWQLKQPGWWGQQHRICSTHTHGKITVIMGCKRGQYMAGLGEQVGTYKILRMWIWTFIKLWVTESWHHRKWIKCVRTGIISKSVLSQIVSSVYTGYCFLHNNPG